MQECGKTLKSGGPQWLNRVDMYGKNLIPTNKSRNLGAMFPLASSFYTYGLMYWAFIVPLLDYFDVMWTSCLAKQVKVMEQMHFIVTFTVQHLRDKLSLCFLFISEMLQVLYSWPGFKNIHIRWLLHIYKYYFNILLVLLVIMVVIQNDCRLCVPQVQINYGF